VGLLQCLRGRGAEHVAVASDGLLVCHLPRLGGLSRLLTILAAILLLAVLLLVILSALVRLLDGAWLLRLLLPPE
jgi:hypothetical protein